jgi:endonuclease YncB( thermonuclease family)
MAKDYARARRLQDRHLSGIRPDNCRKRIAYEAIDGRDLGEALIAAGLARPYSGRRRPGWC